MHVVPAAAASERETQLGVVVFGIMIIIHGPLRRLRVAQGREGKGRSWTSAATTNERRSPSGRRSRRYRYDERRWRRRAQWEEKEDDEGDFVSRARKGK